MKNKQLNSQNILLVTLNNFVVSLFCVNPIYLRCATDEQNIFLEASEHYVSDNSVLTYSEPAMMIISINSPQFLLLDAEECFIVGTWDSF